MTLTELLTTMETQGYISASRVKDTRTSIRYLARALGKDMPEECKESDFVLSTAIWKEKLDNYFLAQQKQGKTISSHTLRNTRNNLSFLFRTAHDRKLLSTPQPLPQIALTRAAAHKLRTQTSPFAKHWQASHAQSYRLAFDQWPPDIQTTWHTYCDHRQLKTRPITLRKGQNHLSDYFGFLVNVEKCVPQWDDLFNVTSLDRFVRWHSQRLSVLISTQARMTVDTVRTLASHFDHPTLPTIKHYFRDLPIPEPLHDKQRNSPTLHDLETVGLALLQDAYKSFRLDNRPDIRHGMFRSLTHQHALMLRLLVRIPLRSRNLRELQLDKNLYKDDAGDWHLHFSGMELKVGTRNGRTNTYHVNLSTYCPDLLSHLEEFLTLYRPRLRNAAHSPLLFLTRRGRPFDRSSLYIELSTHVFMRTKSAFIPI